MDSGRICTVLIWKKMEKNENKYKKIRRKLPSTVSQFPLVFYGRCGFVTEARCKLSDYIIRQQLREIAEKIDDGGEINKRSMILGGKRNKFWGTVFWSEWSIWSFSQYLDGGFKDFIFSSPTLGKIPNVWLIIFRWVETTNQFAKVPRTNRLPSFFQCTLTENSPFDHRRWTGLLCGEGSHANSLSRRKWHLLRPPVVDLGW